VLNGKEMNLPDEALRCDDEFGIVREVDEGERYHVLVVGHR